MIYLPERKRYDQLSLGSLTGNMFFVLLIILLCVVLYLYSVRNQDYWAKRNVKHDPPIPLFGNHLQNQLSFKSITEVSVDLYNRYPGEKVVGYLRGPVPELVIRDLDLIKQIMTVDFPYFYERGLRRNPEKEPLFDNLFHAEGDRWRLLRKRLTPAFTTAKLRAMFPLIIKCAERLQDLVTDLSTRGVTYDARDLMARFTIEFIGACGLGIEMDALNNERSQFRELGRAIFSSPLRVKFLVPMWELFPELRPYLKVRSAEVEDILTSIVKQIREQRNFKPVGRHDFVDMLLELESQGKIVGESIEQMNNDGSPVPVEMEMDLQCQVAQVFIFFAAGFETSSSATSFCLHTLAYHPEIQKKIQEEIDTVLSKYNNRLCYDAIAELTLLEMAFKESLRMFPSLGVLNRVCTRRYKIPGLDITIDPGVKVIIPVQAIHMDEKYYDNPTEFRPERFAPEAMKGRHHFAYLPFGEGPRACIGLRLGLMQSLAGLAAILHRFSVQPAPTSKRHLEVNHAFNIVQNISGGIPLNFIPRNVSK